MAVSRRGVITTPLELACFECYNFIDGMLLVDTRVTVFQFAKHNVPDSSEIPTQQDCRDALEDSLELPRGTLKKMDVENITWTQLRKFLTDLIWFEHCRHNPGSPLPFDIPPEGALRYHA